MSIRRVRGSFKGSLRRYGSVDAGKKPKGHSNWIFKKGEWRISYENGDEASLMYAKHEKIPLKDFGSEVRASMDVVQFLNQAVLFLDIHETSLDGIIEKILQKVLDQEEPHCTVDEAKKSLFANDSVHLLSKTIQGTCGSDGGGFDYDQSWICALSNLPSLHKRHVAIARLKHPANMGRTSHEIKFLILVLTPNKEKGTKNALETGRTFATIFADMEFRQRLLEVHTEEEFKITLLKHAQDLAEEQSNPDKRLLENNLEVDYDSFENKLCRFGYGIRQDLKRRLPHYLSDYTDGMFGHRTIHKVISTTLFLYFACILPAIAFGVLNDNNTNGKIDMYRMIIGQTIGGLFFGIFGGQPLIIIMTTAPLSLYVKTIHTISTDFGQDFYAMYCCVGIWNSFFLILYSLFDVSRLMNWSTRSTEEIFALFISIAFCVDVFVDVNKNFQRYYFNPKCQGYNSSTNITNVTGITTLASDGSVNGPNGGQYDTGDGGTEDSEHCARDSSLLYLLLMFGTLWLGVSLYNFNKTPYLQASKRECLADYSLPVAVLSLSFVGSYIFKEVKMDHFRYSESNSLKLAPLDKMSPGAIAASMGLGFTLSLLFFMDQNITEAMVCNPCNKLKKGSAFHFDLFIVAILNAFLSIFGLPWMHATLPHSPLHVRGLADVEERVDQGHVYEIIVKVRETRLTSIISHVMIGLSMFMLPLPLGYIPTAVLEGLFLYMAVTSLNGNQMFERITLLFMEQAAYPPNHYIRRCPQRKIHQFTALQVIQLVIMCVFGFAPFAYVKMVFPVIIMLLLPIRHKVIPLLIEDKYIEALDGANQ
ncbi:SLC4A11 (predicted) [Pycnogonum litorale]